MELLVGNGEKTGAKRMESLRPTSRATRAVRDFNKQNKNSV